MKKVVISLLCLFLINCAKIETASSENTPANSNKTVAVSPTIENEVLLKPIIPDIKLSFKQQKFLDKVLPPQVREVLEKAEKFELSAELSKQRSESDLIDFQPNVIAKIDNENIKKIILESFYADAATDENAANCYEPRHGLHAIYEEKIINIEICFTCAKFYVKSSFGNFEGTIRRDNRKSEALFNELIIDFGNIIK